MNTPEYQEFIDECLADETNEIVDQIMADEEHGA
jgi:hypothetical protein